LDKSGRAKAPSWLNSQPHKTWLDEIGRAKAPDWLNSQTLKTWLDETGRAKAPDWLNSQTLKTWLDKSGRAKAPDWLNSEPRKTWLDESGRAKAPDRLNSEPRKIWLEESGTSKAPDWLTSQPLKTRLAGFYMCWNRIGRFLQCFSNFRVNVLLTFEDDSSMFFWPLVMTHRCFVDLWTLLIDVWLTFSFDVFFTSDLWPPQTNKQTNKRILIFFRNNFFRNTLPSVEGIEWPKILDWVDL
jgi:hypothetical protein